MKKLSLRIASISEAESTTKITFLWKYWELFNLEEKKMKQDCSCTFCLNYTRNTKIKGFKITWVVHYPGFIKKNVEFVTFFGFIHFDEQKGFQLSSDLFLYNISVPTHHRNFFLYYAWMNLIKLAIKMHRYKCQTWSLRTDFLIVNVNYKLST